MRENHTTGTHRNNHQLRANTRRCNQRCRDTTRSDCRPIPEGLYSAKTFSEEEMPSFGVSVWTSLVPVVLMAMRAIAEMILPKGHAFLPVAEFLVHQHTTVEYSQKPRW